MSGGPKGIAQNSELFPSGLSLAYVATLANYSQAGTVLGQ
jgi:hypothetical protein